MNKFANNELTEQNVNSVGKQMKMATSESCVEIGYLEKTEPCKLESRFFPSKVGGKPAWLDLKNIPVDISCGVCGKTCIFLCQVYAPVEGQTDTYHRTIYIFICRDPECCSANKCDNFIVFRCQLPKENDYYVPEEPNDNPDWHPECTVDRFARTCVLCGCLASFRCGECKSTNYCSKEHQILDWKAGHNATCGSNEQKPLNILFPEYELLTEQEVLDEENDSKQEKSDEEKLKEYEELLREGKASTATDVPDSILEGLAGNQEDKYFQKFKTRLGLCPDQVLRYSRGGQPLWITEPNLPEQGIPNCEMCQCTRQFEFQILPTLLNYLNVDSLGKSIDWGVLLVFTCKNSCGVGPTYKREVLWKQDVL